MRQHARTLRWLIIIIVLVIAHIIAIRITQPDLVKLVTAAPKARQILDDLLRPDFLVQASTSYTMTLPFAMPCGSADAAAEQGRVQQDTVIVKVTPACANPRDPLTIQVEGLERNSEVTLRWRLPNGNPLGIQVTKADANGTLTVKTQARPIAATKDGVPAQIEARVQVSAGAWTLSPTLREVVDQLFVTIFMALLATTVATLIAAPLSFLAARNITGRTPLGRAIYFVTRSVFNLTRSYEPLVLATIFALIVGFGSPFAGVLSLIVVTVASLGKMFSESVETIDSGQIEAVTATGADRAQTIGYAVVPQIVPDFLSFIIYHWDINVRISTVIGFVGGGGIGYYLSQRLNTFEYHKAGTALFGIVLVVIALDLLSTAVRKRLT